MTNDANLTPGRELSGKVVLVTGAARNIGRAIAAALAAGGADVMVNALHSRIDLDTTVRAAGVLFGRAGEAEFADDVVARSDVIALRDRVRATADPAIGEASADVTVMCTDGRRLRTFVRHAIGSLERPMTDADLARKFHDLVDPVLGAARAARLIEQCSALAACDDVRAFTAQTRD